MKLSNLSVIFIVIAIPLVLILSYYISLQRDTINMQTAYNTKLLDSTKEAIEAFEINTVEWNEAYSETADSKRRDIMASINTFTTSLANNLGVSGTSKEYLLAHIPAIAFTLYDGCYIYSPSETKFTVKNEDGVTQFMSKDLAIATGYKTATTYNKNDDGKILYQVKDGVAPVGTFTYEDSNGNLVTQSFTLDPDDAVTTKQKGSQDYPHILKPFTAYSESVTSGSGKKMVINYTLDNYVTIYGDFGDGEGYVSHSGYLNVTSNSISDSKNDDGIYIEGSDFTNKTINEIYFSGMKIEPELLSETIAYKDGSGNIKKASFNYVYEAEKDTKVYYDKDQDKFFRLGNDLKRVYVEDLPEPLYKKCTIPTGNASNPDYLKVYQRLVKDSAGRYPWYVRSGDTYILIEPGIIHTKTWGDKLYPTDSLSPFYNNLYDYSAINYCVETYVFTTKVNNLVLKYTETKEDGSELTHTIKIDKNNDPEKDESEFTQHKRKVIRGVIEENLNQAITSYSRHTKEEYRLPKLKETEWDQVLSNVSIITFLQNIPIGLKYYNNYAIATSTFNKEYVDPDEIYIYDQSIASDLIYHSPYCDKLTNTSDLIGYRSIDYMYKNYEEENAGNKQTKYYFKHTGKNASGNQDIDKPVNQSCYYCLVQRALYSENIDDNKKKAYYTALARERYLQLDSITIEESDIDIKKTVDKTSIPYGDTATYTIEITNNGSVNDVIKIIDYYDGSQITNISDFTYNGRDIESYFIPDKNTVEITEIDGTKKTYNCKFWDWVPIDAGETIKIEFKATIIGNIGSVVTNTALVRANSTSEIDLDQASTSSTITKDITIEAPQATEDPNVILVLDRSASMLPEDRDGVQNAASELVKILGEENVTVISFAQTSSKLNNVSDYSNIFNALASVEGISTNYLGALDKAKNYLKSDKSNYIIFMSDGSPTNTQFTGIEIPGIILSSIEGIAEGLISAITGGWLECVWESEDSFGVQLLVTAEWTYDDIIGISKAVWKGAEIKIGTFKIMSTTRNNAKTK